MSASSAAAGGLAAADDDRQPLTDEQGRAAEELRVAHASAGKAMAAATFAMALASGFQALLYLRSFGVDGRTDAFFTAFALYATFGIFSQSLRVTSVPLLVGASPRITVRELAASLALIGGVVLVATVPLAGPLSELLAPGVSEADRVVAREALPLLGLAMVLVLWTSGTATLLAVRGRFNAIAASYSIGAAAGLATYLAVQGSAGELSLAWSMLAMAAVSLAAALASLRGTAERSVPASGVLHPRKILTNTVLLLAHTGVYLAFNGLYLITVSAVSHYEVGAATVLAYAYLYASYLVAGTGFALGMTRISDMARGARGSWRSMLADTVPPGFRYAMLISAPALALLIAGGAQLAGELFPASLSARDVELLQLFALLLVPWTAAAQLVNLLLPAMFALGRARFVNLSALPLIALQMAATAIGSALFGVAGAVAALAIAPTAFATVMLVAGAGTQARTLGGEITRDGLRFLALAAAAFGAGALVGAAISSGAAAQALVAIAVGGVLYVLTLARTAPRQFQMLTGRAGRAAGSAALLPEPEPVARVGVASPDR